MVDNPYIDPCLNLSTIATCLQWPLSSVPKVAIVERLNCYLLKFPHTLVGVADTPIKLPYPIKK